MAVAAAGGGLGYAVQIGAALIAGGGGAWLFAFLRRARTGKSEGQRLVAEAELQAAKAAELMLGRYRDELRRADERTTALSETLLQRNEQIAELERRVRGRDADLQLSEAERAALRHELERRVRELADAQHELEQAKRDREQLLARIAALEALTRD